jgi:hypothetical protein
VHGELVGEALLGQDPPPIGGVALVHDLAAVEDPVGHVPQQQVVAARLSPCPAFIDAVISWMAPEDREQLAV